MVKKYDISFHETDTPITEAVTKFGGQPVWFTKPQWPLSRQTHNPMRFVGQVSLDPAIFGDIPGKMAYIFITDEDEFIDDTWKPDGGENAVIIQPGGYADLANAQATGPSLYRMAGPPPGENLLVPVACEYMVELHSGEEPEFIDERVLWQEGQSKEDREAYYSQVATDAKIGGTPAFLQNTEFPDDRVWQLILQIDSAYVPFSINFGDMGWGYVFLSPEGTIGKFLWQC